MSPSLNDHGAPSEQNNINNISIIYFYRFVAKTRTSSSKNERGGEKKNNKTEK